MFSRWFLLFLPPKILLISCHPRLLFWYLLFRYRWAHRLCFLSMNDLIEEWLGKVNAISMPGTIKSWIVDNVIVSRFSWPLLVYDFPQSVVQNWSNRCVSFYKKWLKMSKCAETSILFRNRQENFGLGFKNLEIENKCFQIVKWHILKYSLDGQMRSLYEHKLKGRKTWKG